MFLVIIYLLFSFAFDWWETSKENIQIIISMVETAFGIILGITLVPLFSKNAHEFDKQKKEGDNEKDTKKRRGQ